MNGQHCITTYGTPNFQHLPCGEFDISMARSTRLESYRGSVAMIFFFRKIFEIVNTIVGLVAILVVYVEIAAASTKSKHHQSVDHKLTANRVAAEHYPLIAMASNFWMQHPASEVSGQPFNCTQARNFIVSFIAGNWLPCFHMKNFTIKPEAA